MKNKLWITLVFLSLLSTFATAQKTWRHRAENLSWERAIILFENKNYSSAQTEFEQIIESNLFTESQKIDAQYYVGTCALRLNQPDNYSVNYLLNFSEKNPNHSKSQLAIYQVANHYYQTKKFKDATDYYNKISLTDFPKELRDKGRFQLAYSYFELSEYDLAEPNFDRVKHQENEYQYAANYYSGYIKMKKDKYEEALADFKVAEKNDVYASAVPVMVTNIYYKLGRFEDLLKYAVPLAESKKNITNKNEITGLIAETYFEKGDYVNAKKWYEAYTGGKKSTPSVNYKYGYSSYVLEDYQSAANQFKLIAGDNDTIPQAAAFYLGNCYVKLKEKKYAINAYTQARNSKIDKKITQQAMFNEGKLHYENKNYSLAISILKQLSDEYPNFSELTEVRNIISESYLNGNDYTSALNYLESLGTGLTKRQKTVYQKVAHQQAINYYNTNKYSEALNYFEKSMTARTDNNLYMESVFYRAETLSNLGEWSKAINNYADVFRMDPYKKTGFYYKSFYGIGYAYFNTEEYSKAKSKFEDYLKSGTVNSKSPYYSSALLRLGDCLLKERKFTEARLKYQEVIDLKSAQTPYAKYMTALTYYYENKNVEALATYNDLVEKHSNSIWYERSLFQQGYINIKEGKNSEAAISFSKLISEKPQSKSLPEAYYYRARANTALKIYDKAIADYDYIIKNFCRVSINGKTSIAADAISELESISSLGALPANEYLLRLEAVSKCVPGIDIEFKKLELAKNQYFEGQPREAIASFDGFLKEYPDSKYTLDAYYYLGEASFGEDDLKTAKFYLEKVHKVAPNTFFLDATYYLSQIALKENDYEGIKKYNQILVKNAQNQNDLIEATLNLAKSNYELKQYDLAIEHANKILNTEQTKVSASNEANLYKAKSLYLKSDTANAKIIFVKLASGYKDKFGAESKYYLAKIEQNKKNYKASNEILYALNQEFGAEKLWVSKSYLMIGDNLLLMGEVFQAEATYESIIKHTTYEEVKTEAKQKVAKIKAQKAKEAASLNNRIDTLEIGH
jgi:TolA-binding protein